MSFRKRSEIISGGNRIPNAVPGRETGPITSSVPGRSPIIPGRAPVGGINRNLPISRTPLPLRTPQTIQSLENDIQMLSVEEVVKHPGVRPSSVTSQPTASTGSSDLDKILLHQGLPLGSSILIQESGTTDFASVLLKSFASQGIIQNRLDPKVSNTHIICVSFNTNWGKELPGVYKGSSREVKKAKIANNENKVSVQNLLDGKDHKPRVSQKDLDLKIAWRYGLNDNRKQQQADTSLENEIFKDFNNQFDITSRLVPSPGANELTYIPLGKSFSPVIKQIEKTILQNKSKIVRLVIPSLLNPSMYPPSLSSPQEIIPFIHSLRSLLRKYHQNLIIAVSISLDLYPRESYLAKSLENLFDAVIHLEPFNQDMIKFLEKAYQSQPTKVQHGLLNIYKIPNLSERGQMLITKSEFAFKNGKKRFEIEEWGIPVEDEGEPQQTTQNIDF